VKPSDVCGWRGVPPPLPSCASANAAFDAAKVYPSPRIRLYCTELMPAG
jgi:hypothetical protein